MWIFGSTADGFGGPGTGASGGGGGGGGGLGGSKGGGSGLRFMDMLPPTLGNQDSPIGGGPDMVDGKGPGSINDRRYV